MSDIQLVRTLTGNNEVSDDFISFQLKSSADFIKAYCNINSVPQGLHSVYIEIAALKVSANSSEGSISVGSGVKSVSSITDGNQSVSFASSGKSFASNDDFVLAYGSILNRYRKMAVSRDERVLGSRCLHPNKTRW